MSNTGNWIQKMIDQSRGKPLHSSRRTGASLRTRRQIIFEETNPLLAKYGGSTDPATTQRHFSKKTKGRQVRDLIKKGELTGEDARAALSLVKGKKKVRRLMKLAGLTSTGILGAKT